MNGIRIKLFVVGICVSLALFVATEFIAKVIPLGDRAAYIDEPPENDAELLDQIDYVLYGDEETVVLCRSDIEKSTIDGRILSPDEWIATWATYLDAQRLKITADEDDVDKTLLNVQGQYGLTEDDLRNMFKEGGYTWEEARRQLAVMQMEKSRIDWEMASHAGDRITDEQIAAYCHEHPVHVAGHYTLQRAWVPLGGVDRKIKKEELKQKIEENDLPDIAWSPAYTLEEDELPDEAFYITSLQPEQICEPQETPDGFELIKLVSKVPGHYQSVEERRVECEDILKDLQYQKVVEDYQGNVVEKTLIVAY